MPAKAAGLLGPLLRARRNWWCSDAVQDVRLNLQQSGGRCEYFLARNGADVMGIALREGRARSKREGEKRETDKVDTKLNEPHQRLRFRKLRRGPRPVTEHFPCG